VTLAQSLNLSCHTYCLDCGGDGPHDNCIKHNSKATKRTSAKPRLCLTCMYYVSEDDYRTGRCHGGTSSAANTAVSPSSVPIPRSGVVSSYNTTNMSFSAPVSISGAIYSDHRNTECQQIGGDVMCMSQTREERRNTLHMYQKAEMERFRRKCEKEPKEDYDAKLIAIREATRMEIAEETRRIHEQLSTVYSEAQVKAADEYSKLKRQKVEIKRKFERLVVLREEVNNDIQRCANMVTTTTANGENDDAVEPALPYDSRLIDFQRIPIIDGTVRVGLKWAKCVVCNLNQPDYKMEKWSLYMLRGTHPSQKMCGTRRPNSSSSNEEGTTTG
jgi:hypothetical protein